MCCNLCINLFSGNVRISFRCESSLIFARFCTIFRALTKKSFCNRILIKQSRKTLKGFLSHRKFTIRQSLCILCKLFHRFLQLIGSRFSWFALCIGLLCFARNHCVFYRVIFIILIRLCVFVSTLVFC